MKDTEAAPIKKGSFSSFPISFLFYLSFLFLNHIIILKLVQIIATKDFFAMQTLYKY